MNEEQKILALLQEVKDPEIPVLSVIDMGIISGIQSSEAATEIKMTPTFVGCPAIDMMKNQIAEKLIQNGYKNVTVLVDFETQWTSDKMSPEAKMKLEKFGIAPPTEIHGDISEEMLNRARCPHCGSTDTTLRSPFGSTLCRAIRFCFSCKQGFEQFKPI